MAQVNAYNWKIKILLWIEVMILIITMLSFFWLKNVLVGVFSIIFISSIFLWLILLVLTINLKNKIEDKEMHENLKIPEKKRHRFTQPLGNLIAGSRSETIPKVESLIKEFLNSGFKVNVYLVGDIVTNDFLINQFLREFIKLCIVDEKTQRNQINIQNEEYFEEIIEFRNPKGTIRKESFNLLNQMIMSNKRILLKIIEGEEDLLVLPLVITLPLIQNLKTLVFYGQPPITDSKNPIPEGIVMVDVNRRTQKTVKRFLSIMLKE